MFLVIFKLQRKLVFISTPLWLEQLHQAIKAGYLTLEIIEQDIANNLVRSSLLSQVQSKLEYYCCPFPINLELDCQFSPP